MEPPVVLREEYWTKPLRLTMPRAAIDKLLVVQGALFLEMPFMVDWFELPEWWQVGEAMAHAWDKPWPYLNPNSISVSLPVPRGGVSE